MNAEDKEIVCRMLKEGGKENMMDAGVLMLGHELFKREWSSEPAVMDYVSMYADNGKSVIIISQIVLDKPYREQPIKFPNLRKNVFYVFIKLFDHSGDADYYIVPPWSMNDKTVWDGKQFNWKDGVERFRERWDVLELSQEDQTLLHARVPIPS